MRVQTELRRNPKHFWNFVNSKLKCSSIPSVVCLDEVRIHVNVWILRAVRQIFRFGLRWEYCFWWGCRDCLCGCSWKLSGSGYVLGHSWHDYHRLKTIEEIVLCWTRWYTYCCIQLLCRSVSGASVSYLQQVVWPRHLSNDLETVFYVSCIQKRGSQKREKLPWHNQFIWGIQDFLNNREQRSAQLHKMIYIDWSTWIHAWTIRKH